MGRNGVFSLASGVFAVPQRTVVFMAVAETAVGICCTSLLPEILLSFSPVKLWRVF